MVKLKIPFKVSFNHDSIPIQINHSKVQPGPPGGSANRAGYTSVTLKPGLSVTWVREAPTSDGKIPIFISLAEIKFSLKNYKVAISSRYTVGSCPYNATLKHEIDDHIKDPIRIFKSYKDVLIKRLNVLVIPTKKSPILVLQNKIASRENVVAGQIVNVVRETQRELAQKLRKARDQHDQPASYLLIYNKCTPSQWKTGR